MVRCRERLVGPPLGRGITGAIKALRMFRRLRQNTLGIIWPMGTRPDPRFQQHPLGLGQHSRRRHGQFGIVVRNDLQKPTARQVTPVNNGAPITASSKGRRVGHHQSALDPFAPMARQAAGFDDRPDIGPVCPNCLRRAAPRSDLQTGSQQGPRSGSHALKIAVQGHGQKEVDPCEDGRQKSPGSPGA